ncbi:hypothetical protein C8R43DRAFT_1121029 [Mycena crocata]|nr:hypothetical protein C8R43DRAFT_1121029 [Mycena crocata]
MDSNSCRALVLHVPVWKPSEPAADTDYDDLPDLLPYDEVESADVTDIISRITRIHYDFSFMWNGRFSSRDHPLKPSQSAWERAVPMEHRTGCIGDLQKGERYLAVDYTFFKGYNTNSKADMYITYSPSCRAICQCRCHQKHEAKL